MRFFQSEITNIRFLSDELFVLTMESPYIVNTAKPGQFVNIKVNNLGIPLLRRPFSIFNVQKNSFSLLIKIVGRGTKILSEYKPGQSLNILGPLGNGFPTFKAPILVGGGTGIAPLNFYAKSYNYSKAYIGFSTLNNKFVEFLNFDRFVISTEDNSSKNRGFITDFFEYDKRSPVLACGPIGMIKKLMQKVPLSMLYVSLEQVMGCGTGICSGCAVKKRGQEGYFRTCTDGPVFRTDTILI